jgi:hypothetical protein
MWLRVIGYERRVRATDNDRDATSTKVVSEFVSTIRGSRNGRNADQVDIEVQRYVFDAFIVNAQVVLDIVGNQRGKRRQGQGRVTERFAKNTATMTVERAFR